MTASPPNPSSSPSPRPASDPVRDPWQAPMRRALAEAERAASAGDVPVGAGVGGPPRPPRGAGGGGPPGRRRGRPRQDRMRAARLM
ncbi:hypothetical protein ACWGIT_28945, partial [Streptomyces cyaneofuscatus]